MKRDRILFLSCFILLLAANTIYAQNLTGNDFQYRAELKGPIQKGEIYQVVLPGGVLSKMSPGLGDLRLYGPGQKEIPYVMIDNIIPEIPGRNYPLEVIRYQPGKEWITIDLKNPEPLQDINALTLEIPDRDFQKELALQGSDDQEKWTDITRDTIYDFTSQIDLRKVRLGFSNCRYRFFRLKMRDVAKPTGPDQTIRVQVQGADVSINYPDAKKILIQRIEAHTGNGRKAVIQYDHQTVQPSKPITTKDHKTIIDIRTGIRFERIDFEITNPLYYRQVHIYYSETGAEESYQLLADDDIYRTPEQTHNYLLNQFPHHPYFRFEIENKDNLPLTIKEIRLTWVQKLLCFYGLETASGYTLYYGNPQVAEPDYDLKKLISQDNWVEVFAKQNESNRTILMEPAPNPSFRGNFLGKQGKQEGTLLTIVVILLVAGLGIWLYRLLRRVTPNKT
jgi:hypothetical protein